MFESHLKPPISFPTLTGSIVTFNSQYAGLPLKSHKIALTATQSGSGTPSPVNERTINGYSAINIGNISDNTNISYFKGVLNGTYGFVDLGSLEWEYSSDTFYSSGIASTVKEVSISSVANVICAKYTTTTARALSDKCIAIGYLFVANDINIKDSDYTDTATFKNSLNGVYLIYELKTPTTPSFTSAEFEALCEAFGMNGQYVEIQIGSTVYGGTFDAIIGILTVTHGLVRFGDCTFNYFANGSKSSAYRVELSVPTTTCSNNQRHGAISSIAGVEQTAYWGGARVNELGENCFAITTDGLKVCVYDTDTSITQANFLTKYADCQILYPLATQQEIQLSPAQILTLMGQNNIWADTGDTTLQYPKFG